MTSVAARGAEEQELGLGIIGADALSNCGSQASVDGQCAVKFKLAPFDLFKTNVDKGWNGSNYYSAGVGDWQIHGF